MSRLERTLQLNPTQNSDIPRIAACARERIFFQRGRTFAGEMSKQASIRETVSQFRRYLARVRDSMRRNACDSD